MGRGGELRTTAITGELISSTGSLVSVAVSLNLTTFKGERSIHAEIFELTRREPVRAPVLMSGERVLR